MIENEIGWIINLNTILRVGDQKMFLGGVNTILGRVCNDFAQHAALIRFEQPRRAAN